MESSLHKELKQLYAPGEEFTEVLVDGYRIDAIADGRLIEIQAASLSSLVPKVKQLLEVHELTVVKPLAAKKFIIKRKSVKGAILSERFSPKKESVLSLFDELVHFGKIFPHPNLRIEVLLTEQKEVRVPQKKRRRYSKDYRVISRELTAIQSRISVETALDLIGLLPACPDEPFTTQQLSKSCNIPRWLAQKIAYCLRHAGGIVQDGKAGNAFVYRYATDEEQRAA